MHRIKRNIQQKIMRIVLLTSGVVVFLACTAFVTYQFYIFKSSARDQLQVIGSIIAANSTAALAFRDSKEAGEVLMALRGEEHIVAACLYDTTGAVFAKYPDTIAAYDLPIKPGVLEYRFKGSQLQGFHKVIQDDIWVGTLYLRSDLEANFATFFRYAILGILIFSMAIGVAYLLSRRLQQSVSDPITALSRTASIISQHKDYSVRARRYDDDELGLLTDGFNTMLDEIERQNAEITSFSHHLEAKVADRTAALQKANEELRRQTNLFETVVNSSVDVIAVIDASYRYVILNDYGGKVYQRSMEEVIGRRIDEVFPNITQGSTLSDIQRALSGELVHNPYYHSPVMHGILENFFIPLRDANGDVDSVLIIAHDITATVEANERLRQLNLSLESSNRDLEQFAYVASHDLQEPLRKIQIFSSQLLSRLNDKEFASKTIARIISSASRMSDLINGVLNYSRLANSRDLMQPVSLEEIIEAVVNDLELVITEKQATINIEPLPVVTGNKLQLNQLFSNLISNSLKFCDRKPLIEVFASIVPGAENIEGTDENKWYAKISFKDNGIGFSQEYEKNIFSVFQRLHSKEEYPGTGIGLALCKKIVDNHEGHVEVSSSLGEGTTFVIYLPTYGTEQKTVNSA
ncbi:MAG: HAMP domain-containing protein [Chitinophagaceae bacterium]|nr:MAG: HAMP domain-containing protein [Chitinophagaceae bacterium]